MAGPQSTASAVLLMPQDYGDMLAPAAKASGYPRAACVNSRDALLREFEQGAPGLLLGFATGVVVPAEILARPGLIAANVHGAPPSFPGRDPHHFAAYERATCYGATLHYMAPAVDQGPVIRVSLQEVAPDLPPVDLMGIGIAHGLELARGFLEELAHGHWPKPDPALRWTGPVRRRQDFLALCRLSPDISAEEFQLRLHATSMPGRNNLVVELHGRTFRLEDGSPA